jgi:hypothetical protein
LQIVLRVKFQTIQNSADVETNAESSFLAALKEGGEVGLKYHSLGGNKEQCTENIPHSQVCSPKPFDEPHDWQLKVAATSLANSYNEWLSVRLWSSSFCPG